MFILFGRKRILIKVLAKLNEGVHKDVIFRLAHLVLILSRHSQYQLRFLVFLLYNLRLILVLEKHFASRNNLALPGFAHLPT